MSVRSPCRRYGSPGHTVVHGRNRRLSPVVLSLSSLIAASFAEAAFTRTAIWKLDSIDKTFAGTWCFHPGPNPTFASVCTNSTLNALLNIHLHNELGSGLSIAYYDISDGSVLGGAGWSGWSTDDQPIGLCMSGAVRGLDNNFRTICRFAIADDDQDSPAGHTEECAMSRAQLRVTDGCYDSPAHRGPFGLSDTASAILTILGLLIALPGMAYGVYRWYCARRAAQQMRTEGQLEMPLVTVDGATGRV